MVTPKLYGVFRSFCATKVRRVKVAAHQAKTVIIKLSVSPYRLS